MKRLLNSSRLFKALLLAGLVGSLAFKAMAQPTTSIQWSPLDILTDGAGNPYAYYNDANNWAGGIIPSFQDPATGNYYQAKVSLAPGTLVACIITNNTIIGQLMIGDGGGGTLIITNGAQVQAGISNGVSNGEW